MRRMLLLAVAALALAGCSLRYTPDQLKAIEAWRTNVAAAADELRSAEAHAEKALADVLRWKGRLEDGGWQDMDLAAVSEAYKDAVDIYENAVATVASMKGKLTAAQANFKAAKAAGVPAWRIILEAAGVLLPLALAAAGVKASALARVTAVRDAIIEGVEVADNPEAKAEIKKAAEANGVEDELHAAVKALT